MDIYSCSKPCSGSDNGLHVYIPARGTPSLSRSAVLAKPLRGSKQGYPGRLGEPDFDLLTSPVGLGHSQPSTSTQHQLHGQRQHQHYRGGGARASNTRAQLTTSFMVVSVRSSMRFLLGAGATRKCSALLTPVLPTRPTISSRIGFSFTPGLMHPFPLLILFKPFQCTRCVAGTAAVKSNAVMDF